MSADQYLYGILQREAVDTGLFSPVRGVQGVLTPRLQEWAGNLLVSITASGSFAKGTANRSGTDIAYGVFGFDASGTFSISLQKKPATAFLLELIDRLQDCGTVAMIDTRAYAQWLDR